MLNIVPTPIGTIADTSLRVAQTLCESDCILAEDTRVFGAYYIAIQELFSVHPRENQTILSFHEHNEFERLPMILDMLKAGKIVSLVSDAGMPLVSDPGRYLVEKTVLNALPYTVLPGPSALTTAMVHAHISGPTLFVGFLPKKNSQHKALWTRFHDMNMRPLTVCAYESPHRILATLHILNEVMPTCYVTVCRELSKMFETIYRSTPSELLEHEYKGEITLVVEIS